jgi:hypothetical protein
MLWTAFQIPPNYLILLVSHLCQTNRLFYEVVKDGSPISHTFHPIQHASISWQRLFVQFQCTSWSLIITLDWVL